MLVGYAWVSTDDHNLNLQRDALQSAGCEKIFEDQISGAKLNVLDFRQYWRSPVPEIPWLSGDWIA